jgi:hypothetical protein
MLRPHTSPAPLHCLGQDHTDTDRRFQPLFDTLPSTLAKRLSDLHSAGRGVLHHLTTAHSRGTTTPLWPQEDSLQKSLHLFDHLFGAFAAPHSIRYTPHYCDLHLYGPLRSCYIFWGAPCNAARHQLRFFCQSAHIAHTRLHSQPNRFDWLGPHCPEIHQLAPDASCCAARAAQELLHWVVSKAPLSPAPIPASQPEHLAAARRFGRGCVRGPPLLTRPVEPCVSTLPL